jgi:putative Holliday junction resolvase
MTARTKLLGVDYGSARVGLAVTDPERKFAFPLATYHRRGRDEDAAFFRDLVAREEVGGLVVGLPLHTDGREGQKAAEARAFGRWLAETNGLPAAFFDERFTTAQAESALWSAGLTHAKRKERRDRVAAQILLQAYLEAGCPADEGAGPLDG